MTKLIIKSADNATPNTDLGLGNIKGNFTVTNKGGATFAAARAVGEQQELNDINDDDVMLLEFEDGIRLWTSVAQFKEDFPDVGARSAVAGALEIPKALPMGDANRGVSDWVLKSLKVFGVNPVEAASKSIAELVEAQLESEPGIYQCIALEPRDTEKQSRLTLQKPNEVLDGSQPILLFLHGTASSSAGSFGELWTQASAQYLQQLQQHFGVHIYAFEHRTLSEDPIDNAIALCPNCHREAHYG